MAIQALRVLDAEAARQLLQERFDSAAADEPQMVWAAFLLQLGDARGLPLLQATAERATGDCAVFAAAAIAEDNALLGARLMLRAALLAELFNQAPNAIGVAGQISKPEIAICTHGHSSLPVVGGHAQSDVQRTVLENVFDR